ncbi:hypothetical protein ACP4OV_006267 [Aristida adscensionis]
MGRAARSCAGASDGPDSAASAFASVLSSSFSLASGSGSQRHRSRLTRPCHRPPPPRPRLRRTTPGTRRRFRPLRQDGRGELAILLGPLPVHAYDLIEIKTAPADFRFPTTNQTRHCFTRYIEYHRCLNAKGDSAGDCEKFAQYYRSLCPGEWVEKWNEQRENGTFPGPL